MNQDPGQPDRDDNLIGNIMMTNNGITEGSETLKTLSISSCDEGKKSIYIQNGEDGTLFTLTEEQCRHLAILLTP